MPPAICLVYEINSYKLHLNSHTFFYLLGMCAVSPRVNSALPPSFSELLSYYVGQCTMFALCDTVTFQCQFVLLFLGLEKNLAMPKTFGNLIWLSSP